MEKKSDLLSYLMGAVANCSLYSEEHPLVGEFAEKSLKLIQDLCEGDSLSIVMMGESLVFNETPYMERGVHVIGFMKKLRKKRIEKIVIRKAVDAEELKKFITGLASRDAVSSSRNISVGIVEVRFGAEADAAAVMEKSASKVRDAFHGIMRFKTLDTVGLEEAVMGFIAALKKEMNILRILCPVKTHSEYTYVHETDVAVITIFQAEALGLKGELLHDIGLAALLHDVGKVFVPAAVIDKPSKLDAEEWVQMQKHPVYGAWYLSRIPEVPSLAPIVAFEHHMKFNGAGYPETKRTGRKQHIVSQMVAISDFFDALRTVRSYRESLDVATISGLMSKGAGTDFNPLLVENFLVALKRTRTV